VPTVCTGEAHAPSVRHANDTKAILFMTQILPYPTQGNPTGLPFIAQFSGPVDDDRRKDPALDAIKIRKLANDLCKRQGWQYQASYGPAKGALVPARPGAAQG
jgi:hypothetical protein